MGFVTNIYGFSQGSGGMAGSRNYPLITPMYANFSIKFILIAPCVVLSWFKRRNWNRGRGRIGKVPGWDGRGGGEDVPSDP